MTSTIADRRFGTADGTALHVEASGPADAPVTLVLVHGWTQDLHTWDRVLAVSPDLLSSTAVVRYDLRGHGSSAPARPGTATIETLADDLADLLAHRAPTGRLVLAGHSMGAMTIMGLAEQHPDLVAERVDAAAFVATSAGGLCPVTLGMPGPAGAVAGRIERRLAARLATYRRDALPLRPTAAQVGARWLVFGKRPSRDDVAQVAGAALRAHPASVGAFQQNFVLHERRVALAALRTTSTVVLAGDRDRLTPLSHAEAIATELPGARFVVYPGAGHMLPQERPQQVATQLRQLVSAAHRS